MEEIAQEVGETVGGVGELGKGDLVEGKKVGEQGAVVKVGEGVTERAGGDLEGQGYEAQAVAPTLVMVMLF